LCVASGAKLHYPRGKSTLPRMPYHQLLQPTINAQGSILDLDLGALVARGVGGLILDFDDTLVPLGAPEVDPQVQQWVEQAKVVFDLKVWIVSNNPNRRFLTQMGQVFGLETISAANKPSRRALRQVMAVMDLPPERIAMIGDRLFTDVLAGNRLGMVTILVKPPGQSQIFWRGGLLRQIERLLVGSLTGTMHP